MQPTTTNPWAWLEAVARLERIRQLAGLDYGGRQPSWADLWKQVNDCHVFSMGINPRPWPKRDDSSVCHCEFRKCPHCKRYGGRDR
jgi:hypothetical protein